MTKDKNNSVRASALRIACSFVLISGSAILLAIAAPNNFKKTSRQPIATGEFPGLPRPAIATAASATATPTPCGKIAFYSDRDYPDTVNYEIYVMNADGSNQTRLTNNMARDYGSSSSFSGDGSKIAFTSDRDYPYPDAKEEIYVMNADGSNQTRLTNNTAQDYAPSFSRDGSKIAFTSNRDNYNNEIYVMNADGSNQTRLTNNTAQDYAPSFSGDGSKIAFHSGRDGNNEIYVMNADGSNQTNLTNNPASDLYPSFSPDGSKIAFHSFRDGNWEIYVMNADGSNVTRLTNNTANDVGASFSPDGGKIAFTSNRDGNNEIYVMNADGSNQTRLTNNTADEGLPSFGGCQPNPNPVIFIHGVSGSQLVDGPPNGDDLWLGPLSDRRRLNLYPNGDPPPSPNIKAVGVLRTALGKPIYGPLLDFLTTTGGYHEYQLPPDGDPTCDTSQMGSHPNLFEFVYDWRQDLNVTAQKLKTFVQCVEQFYPDSKINILTHSMGSLLARRYILANPTDHNVERLVTIGAPWLGAPKLLYAMETGEFIRVYDFGIAAGPDIQYIMPSLAAAHQLLSSRAYQDLGGAPIFEENGYDYDGNGVDHESYDYARVINFLNTKYPSTTPGTTADQFHSYTTAEGAQDDWRMDSTGVDYFHFYGVQFDNTTIEKTVAISAVICTHDEELGSTCGTANLLEPRYTVGDGTVPARSASRRTNTADLNAPNAQVFRMTNTDKDLVEHTGLTQNPDVQAQVLTLLQGGTITSLSARRSGAEANGQIRDQWLQLPDDDDPPSSVPSYYVSVIRAGSVVVSDTNGNSTAPIIGDVLGTVPGVETFHMGDNAEQIVLPVSDSEDYSITFNSMNGPMAIKVVKGVDNVTPTDVIRYQDLVLPSGVAAQLNVTTAGVENVHYDSDGDGTFDTEVQPTLVATGSDALDVTPPSISFSEVPQGTMTEVTVTATDSGSGVHDLSYSTDGTTFQAYTDPLTLDPAETPILYAFASDNVGNRTGSIAYTLGTAGASPTPTPTPTPTPEPTSTPIPTPTPTPTLTLPPPVATSATNVTSSSFTANWTAVDGATGYRLDVSTQKSFKGYVSGYQNLDVGNATNRSVTGLSARKAYYYRVRAYNPSVTSANSNVIKVTTSRR